MASSADPNMIQLSAVISEPSLATSREGDMYVVMLMLAYVPRVMKKASLTRGAMTLGLHTSRYPLLPNAPARKSKSGMKLSPLPLYI